MRMKKMSSSITARARTTARAAVTGLSLALAVGVASTGPLALAAHAQDRGPARRTIAVKSFISDDEGVFHFGQLSQNTDYEIYAEFEGKRSKSRRISSFDSK